VIHGTQGNFFCFKFPDNRLAGQTFVPVDDHAAGSAHAHTAGITKSEGVILRLLDLEEDIQNGGFAFIRYINLEAVVMALFIRRGIIAKNVYDSPVGGIFCHASKEIR
jgi:hypothetical protein